MASKLHFDVASAMEQGRREAQEDAIATDFPSGDGPGIIVLADGMGGHCAGEVASRVVVSEVYGNLKTRCANPPLPDTAELPDILRCAAIRANESLRKTAEAEPSVKGMGSTLVALLQRHDALYWVSVGDSVLYLLRNGKLSRLNEDHSLAPQIDLMVKRGEMSEESGKDHPSRNCLISALTGEPISRMDCPEEPLTLQFGDVIVVASDGLQFLSQQKTKTILDDNIGRSSGEIAEALLKAISNLDDPEQDNVCFSVVKVGAAPLSAPCGEHVPSGESQARTAP